MIPKVRHRLYHSDQDGYRHEKGSRRFTFAPQYPFRPLGLIIFGTGEAILLRVIVGMNDQLIAPIPAEVLGPKEFTIGQLELLVKSSAMQNILNSKGVPTLTMETANIGTYLTVEVSEPVDTVCFWGIEQDT